MEGQAGQRAGGDDHEMALAPDERLDRAEQGSVKLVGGGEIEGRAIAAGRGLCLLRAVVGAPQATLGAEVLRPPEAAPVGPQRRVEAAPQPRDLLRNGLSPERRPPPEHTLAGECRSACNFDPLSGVIGVQN